MGIWQDIEQRLQGFFFHFDHLNQQDNMLPAINHREPPFGVSVVMVLLFFGVNAILFLHFQWIRIQKQANEPPVIATDDEKGEKNKVVHKELSKPFQGTIDCYTNLTAELLRVSLILLMTYICEYLWFFNHSTKTYSRDLFIFVLIIFFGYAFYTIKPIKDLSLLGREQTEEWKGWMQFIFLLYHYFHAEEVYNPVRVMITCYVWMTGFGNFSFFYIKQDFSWLRVVQMLWRLNFSVLLLMWTHQNTWILYYICPMHTFYFLMVYVTMYTFSSLNATKWGIRWKLLVLALIIFAVWDYNHGLFDFLFAFLGTDKVIGANSGSVWEWYFRTSLDHWSTFLGMIFALNFPLCEQFFVKAKGPPLILASIIMGILTIYWFYYYYPLEKLEYNLSHAYFAIIPLTSYIFFRNLTPGIRSGVSMSLHELGKTTLETYLLQHHIWLTSNAKTLWTVTPGNPWINFAIATILFFMVSKELYRLTMSLRGMVLPDDRNIAWRNLIGLVILWMICYGLSYCITLVELSVLEIAIVCVALSGVSLFVIGRFLSSSTDQHLFQQSLTRIYRFLGLLFCVLLLLQVTTHERTHYTFVPSSPSSTNPQAKAKLAALPPFGNTKECLDAVSQGRWITEPCDQSSTMGISKASTTAAKHNSEGGTTAYCTRNEWKWNPTGTDSTCPIKKINEKTALSMLQNKRIVFYGDSITRSAYHGFIHAIDNNYTQVYDYIYKHSSLSYLHPKANISIQFRWTPYVSNLTSEFAQSNKESIDYAIFGAMLWDALNIHDVTHYQKGIQRFAETIKKVISQSTSTTSSSSSQVRVWLMPTEILSERLPTEEKRAFMNQEKILQYRQRLQQVFTSAASTSINNNSVNALLHSIIESQSVSRLREASSVDGVHFTEEVYAVIAQMLLNTYALHFPKLYSGVSTKQSMKPYTPKVTGAMSFPDYGLGMLVTIIIMLFTMDSFFGIGYLSLFLFGRSFDWDAAYGPYIRKIQASVSNGSTTATNNNNSSKTDKKETMDERDVNNDHHERDIEIVPLLSNRKENGHDRDSMA